MGTYTDGCCGTYDAVIEVDSPDCGFTTTTTTPEPTTTTTPEPTTTTTTAAPCTTYQYNGIFESLTVNCCSNGGSGSAVIVEYGDQYCLLEAPTGDWSELGPCYSGCFIN